jgi:general secretion pathway protein C
MSALAFIAVAVLAQVAGGPLTTREIARGIHCKKAGDCVVKRALVDRMLADQESLASTVRIVPSLVDGAPDGFKLYAIRSGSWLDRLGVRNGDTLQAVNGYELTTPAQALLAYMGLRNETRFAVRIVRRGEPLTLHFEIR